MKVIILQQQESLLSASDGLRGEISGYRKSSGGFSQSDSDDVED